VPDLASRTERKRQLNRLTRTWGSYDSVSLYLERCQVATPDALVRATWRHVHESKTIVGKVLDFGAGDGRFSRHGSFERYIGYEIDSSLCGAAQLADNASLINRCAFSDAIVDADVCVGNPPFVRNQDLPPGWRQHAAKTLCERTGVTVSGLANAWQYFFLLALASTKSSGLCALIIPYEWVSRPSSAAARDYISDHGWRVSVYRLVDSTFNSVLTTSSITIVDKGKCDSQWSYFEETAVGTYSRLRSPSGAKDGVIPYRRRRRDDDEPLPYAKRGLSPGTQKVLTLTEGERVRFGLKPSRDVVPCITSLRHLPSDIETLDVDILRLHYRTPGRKCWLIRTDSKLSKGLDAYLAAIPASEYQTSTCLDREDWWRFAMPDIPPVLISMSFSGGFLKAVRNLAGARAVGGVYGIYNLSLDNADDITKRLRRINIGGRVVAHANGLRKIEIGQLNTLLASMFESGPKAAE
jgi:hypothetical protein